MLSEVLRIIMYFYLLLSLDLVGPYPYPYTYYISAYLDRRALSISISIMKQMIAQFESLHQTSSSPSLEEMMEADLKGGLSLSLSSLQVKSQFPAAKIKLGRQSSLLSFSSPRMDDDPLYSSNILNENVCLYR